MKLSSKIIAMSIFIFSFAFGISSYLISKNSYEETLGREVTNCLEQNKMINTMYQIKILQLISEESYDGEESIQQISISNDMGNNQINQAVIDENETVITGNINGKEYIKRLLEKYEEGGQTYLIYKDQKEDTYILTVSGLSVGTSRFYVSNESKITNVIKSLKKQQKNLQITILITLICSCIGIYMCTIFMTKPIQKLVDSTTEIAKGNFQTRTNICSQDEVGKLSESFDAMVQEIEYYIEKLQHENEAKEAFMANFTHELKTPLTTVIGYADLLRRSDLEESERVEGANYIFTEGNRLQKMSMKLLDLFLVGKENLTLQAMYMPALVEEAVESVRESYRKKGIEISWESEECYANGDYELLKTALINLLDNSRKASGKGQVVKVVVSKKETGIELAIIDQGTGIEKEELGRITEAFYMVNKSRTRKEGGAGLGLSLVSAVVKAIGATLAIESTIGKGTRISILLKEEAYEA